MFHEKGPAYVSGTAVNDNLASVATAFGIAIDDGDDVPGANVHVDLFFEGQVLLELVHIDGSPSLWWLFINADELL